MKIKFSITKELDIEQIIKDEEQKKWFWKNSFPSISEETRPEELTDAQKIALIKLLIYEGWLGREDDLANLPDSNFALINEPVETTNEQPKKKTKKKCNNLSGLCTCDLGYPCKKG